MKPVIRYEKPATLARIPKDRHAVIEASAGTGKTYTLEHLVVELVLRGVPIHSILAVTFTERAASELTRRVRAKLQELRSLSADVGDVSGPEETFWRIDDDARCCLEKALLDFDAATITTIHGFCYRVLTEHAFGNQQLLDQTHVDSASVFSAAFRDQLRRRLATDEEVVPFIEAAWSRAFKGQHWKGTEAVEEVESALHSCARQAGELRPRFSARLMAEVLDAARPDEWEFAEGSKTLVKHGERIQAMVSAYQASGDLVAFLAPEPKEPTHNKQKWLRVPLLAHLACEDVAKGRRIPVLHRDAVAIGNAYAPLWAAIVQMLLPATRAEFSLRKRQLGLVDFDDMLHVLRDALAGPAGGALREVLRERYRCALIDEFQDTDPVQWEIFRRLFFDSSDGHVLYLVGDPKQAIYSFRGADVFAYVDAKKAVEEVSEPVPLIDCYRATSQLIDAYNAIFEQLEPGGLFSGAIQYDNPVACGKPKLQAVNDAGAAVSPVHILHLAEQGAEGSKEAEWAASLGQRIGEEIRSVLYAEPPPLLVGEPGKQRRPAARDIFVLTRKTKEGRAIGAELGRLGVPHAFYKQAGLFQTVEAQEIEDLLAAVADPDDRRKRARAWMTPFFGVRLRDVARCADVAGDHPLLKWLYEWNALANQRHYEALVQDIVEKTGVLRRELFFQLGERRLANFIHLFETVLEEARREPRSLTDLVLMLRAYRRQDATGRLPAGVDSNVQRLESERNAVQIMTAHMSKGLEADVVFLAGGWGEMPSSKPVIYHEGPARIAHLNPKDRDTRLRPTSDGGYLSAQERANQESGQEDERLLYVALTRARARLYLPYLGPLEGAAIPAEVPPGVRAYKERKNAPKNPLTLRAKLEPQLARLISSAPPEVARHFTREIVAMPYRAPRPSKPRRKPEELELPAPPPPPSTDYAGLGSLRAGPEVTSFSQQRARLAGAGRRPSEGATDEQVVEDRAELVSGPDDVPRGAAAGSFLHDVIERLDRAALTRAESAEAWGAEPANAALLARSSRRWGIPSRTRGHAAALIYRTLKTPVVLREGRRLEALAEAQHASCELEFAYPIPETGHPPLGALPSTHLTVETGYLRGYIDYVFEHDGLAYVADWKSDSLPSYDASNLAAHIRSSYLLQAKIYALALVRMLAPLDEAGYEQRFGGILYCFMRGMDGSTPHSGAYYRRPSWAAITAWNEQLARGEWLALATQTEGMQ